MLECLEELERSGRLQELSRAFLQNLQDIAKKYNSKFDGVSGLGLMLGLVCKDSNLQERIVDKALEQMLKKNCTRSKFADRYKRIIDSYNSGGTENEDYFEQLTKLVAELKEEENRANVEGLNEEELEIYDLLITDKKLSKADEQKVKLSAKNLYTKLIAQKDSLLVVDWYKDEQPKAKVKSAIKSSLDETLPESYDVSSFNAKTELLLNHFIDMAVQGYGWISSVA